MEPNNQQDLNARSDAGSFAAAGSLATLEQEVQRRRKNRFQLRRQRWLFTGLAGVFVVLVLAGVGFSTYKFFQSRWFRQPADLFSVQSLNIAIGDLSASVATIPLQSQNTPSQLGLNGDLRVGGSLSLSQQGIENLGQVLTNKLDLQSNLPALAQAGNASITGTVGAAAFVGGGSQLTALNANTVTTGAVAAARLSPEVSLLGQSVSVTQIQPNIISSVNGLFGSGGNITLVGDGDMSISVTQSGVELSQNSVGTGISQVTVGSGLSGGGNLSITTIAIDGSVATLQGNAFNAANQLIQLNGSGGLAVLDGSLLSNLSAGALMSGTVNDARLSTNVVFKDAVTNVFVPIVNSTSVFAVRNAAGSQDVLRGDTANQRVGIGYSTATAPSYTLDVYGDINVEPPSSTLLVGGVQICGALTCAAQEGSTNYIQNSTVMQSSANIAIQSAGFSSIAGRIRAASGQTANLLQIEDETAASVFEIAQSGSLLLQGEYLARPPATVGAFTVAYAPNPAINIFRVDTNTERVGILLTDVQTPQYRLDLDGLGGDINLASGSVMRIGGVAVCSSLGCSGNGTSIDYIRNSTTLQTGANFFVQSATAGGLGAVRLAGASGQTADILSVEESSGDQVLSVTNIGEVRLAAVANASDTLEVLDAIGGARFAVDTATEAVHFSDGGSFFTPGAANVYAYGNGDALVVNQTGSGDLVQLSNLTGTVMQVTASGETLFRTTTNATNAFSIFALGLPMQNVFNVDTSQGSINLGGSTYSSQLGLTTSGSKVGQTINNTGTADSLRVQRSGVDVVSVSDTGTFRVQPSVNTSGAVQVKSSAGADVLQVATGDTSTNSTPALSFNAGANGEVGSWSTNGTAMNKALRDAGYAYMNGYMYRIGGTQQASRSTFTLETEVARAPVRADGSVGTWTAIGTLNDSVSWAPRSGLGVTAINGAIYTFGGYRFNNNVSNMHNGSSFAKLQADGSLSSWIQVNFGDGCCTSQRAEAPLVNDGLGNMYYLGGTTNYAGTPLSGVYRETVRGNLYTSFGSWPHNSGISALPGGRAGHRAEIANGYLYAIGGYSGANGAQVRDTVYYAKLNGSGGAGAWSTANAMPMGLKYHCSGVANGYMYVWGGDTGSSISNAIYYAKLNNDGSLGAWQTSAQTMPAAVASSGCAVINGRLYSFGGVTSGGTTTSAVYYAETAKVRMYASLDLIGLDSANLAGTGEDSGASLMNGSARGGSLFAGTISATGSLQATGSAQLAGGVAILDRLATSGDSLIRVTNNSGDKSVVVDTNTGARVFTIDSLTTGETVGVNVGDVWGAIDAKMAVNGVTVGQNIMQVTDTSNGTLQAMTIADGGATTFTNDCSTAAQCDETQAFQIQNASGASLFTVDTLNARLTLGSTPANFDIDFEQNSSNRSAIVRDFVCTASETAFDIVEFNGVDTVVRTTNLASVRVAGVVVSKPATTTCTTAIGGVVQVNFGVNPAPASIGDPVETSGIAGAAQSTTTPTTGAVLGNSISSKDGSNRVWVRLRRD